MSKTVKYLLSVLDRMFYNQDHDDQDTETETSQRLAWRLSPWLIEARVRELETEI